ncbi:MAG: G/U mismatch-specific DNA glycosylase [Gemmatimonadota bacterium]
MTGSRPCRPTKQDLADAVGRPIADLIAPDLHVLFCGINPGLYSAATGHHFARPGNRFWPSLHAAGFTARILHAWEERELLTDHLGITNLVARATVAAAELSADELVEGRAILLRKVRKFGPRWVAVLGIGAYRLAFAEPKATLGRQANSFGSAGLWVLPNPSGLNASHQLPDLARAFRALREAAASDSPV